MVSTTSVPRAPNYGFIIDNRRCIGCHACTVACKAEHDDPIGINKTWVQYIEKGIFPATVRAFHVLRCNHCADAPCVEICPTASLEKRVDGIVDFDPGRCIGCKACMQACPYDAITIHPDSGTATKCNYCSHRVDTGRAPACVVVCPVEAIVSGDMNDPTTRISQILATTQTTVRKPEKGTHPQLHYVNGDSAALTPSAASRSTTTLWGSRLRDATDNYLAPMRPDHDARGAPRRTYDIAQRHAGSWGWKVSAYLFTKSIAAGVMLVPILFALVAGARAPATVWRVAVIAALVGLALTGILLVADLRRPTRFLWVLLRPQWRSWLVRGAYIITGYGACLSIWYVWQPTIDGLVEQLFAALCALLAAGTAAYSGWLFGQAKGRDLWQSPLAPLHLLLQAVLAGMATLLLIVTDSGAHAWLAGLEPIFATTLVVNASLIGLEVWGRHSTADAKRAAHLMSRGVHGRWLVLGALIGGHGLPLCLLPFAGNASAAAAGVFALVGLLIYEHLWVDAPQRIALA
ncbi:MAG: 4Fe-4S dicluster domain-containing protein [Planctomycetota bacterium]